MISEGSCDTEDWSNDAENSAIKGINNILKYIKTVIWYLNKINDKINEDLISIQDFFQKHSQI